jgi:F0F1-type ATP synthase membrane subunit b/b'
METTYFVLGMLTIVAVTLLTAVVVGLVKINKLTKQQETINADYHREIENLYRSIHEMRTDLHRSIEQEVEMTRKYAEHEIQSIHRHEDELHREIEETKKYVDSRIDKTILSGSFKGSKQVING